jgi:hypothetical protein
MDLKTALEEYAAFLPYGENKALAVSLSKSITA